VADPKPLEEYDLSIQQRWGCADNQKMRFDFEYGAIDTQPVNGGVLLVVTAQVFFESPKNGDVSSSSSTSGSSEKAAVAKSFVQTFFLVREGRNFACYNDVLRFLELPVPKSEGPSTPTATASTNTISTSTVDVGVATDEPETEKVDQMNETTQNLTNVLEVNIDTTPALIDEAPGGGVEEMKEEAPEEDEEVLAKRVEQPMKEGRGKKSKGGPKGQQLQHQQQRQSANKPTPGSWASLVASGGSAPNTPSRRSAPAPESEKGSEAPGAAPEEMVQPKDSTNEAAPSSTKDDTVISTTTNTTTTSSVNNINNKPSSKGQPFPQRPKRDPDNTLVVKNLSDNIKEADIINMFKPFAVQTNSKLVGTNLNHHRGLAFVDFDQVAPVKAALAKHEEIPLQWNGKVLEVDQKTLEVRARRQKAGGSGSGSGYHRSGSPGNGLRNGGAGRGGGDHRRGDRGGRRSGRGGRGGR
jgi:hypothetical protein